MASASGASNATSNNSAPSASSSSAPSSNAQNLNNIVIEYLNKKGYSKTEAMLRQEMAPADGQSARPKEDKFPQYDKAYSRLVAWVDNSLDLYKPELQRVKYPVFVHMYLALMSLPNTADAKKFFQSYEKEFRVRHGHDLKQLQTLEAPIHVEENPVARLFTENTYHVTLTVVSYNLLMTYLSELGDNAGDAVIHFLNTNCTLHKVQRHSLLGMSAEDDMLGENEGILGHSSGSGPAERALAPVKLGLMPMDKDLIEDVEYELAGQDAQGESGADGGPSFLETFQQHIKREESEDTPMRDDLPLPPYRQADIDAEIKAVRDYRDRYSLSTITGQPKTQAGVEGPQLVGAPPSVLTYTFHNSAETVHRIAFSSDTTLCATSHADAFVKLWSLSGEKLVSMNPSNNVNVSTTRRYTGHSGAVYGLSFSRDAYWLLSGSADKTIRLWSLKTHTAIVPFKGHDGPVWDVAWGPFDHYFASASWDRTARVWSTEHIAPVRYLVGHLDSINKVAWHPNGAYVFTASSDKTLRMWDMQQGSSVRLFNGHTLPVRCLQVSPNGKYLASGCDDGTINIWDIAMGKRIKTMRGHAKVPIWSLSWSVESTVLVSGGADSTIRVWSVGEDKGNIASNSAGTVGAEIVINGIGGLPGDGTTKVDTGSASAANLGVLGSKGRKDKKDVVATNDQICVYYTKRTPVHTVTFTKKNLVLAGGVYTP